MDKGGISSLVDRETLEEVENLFRGMMKDLEKVMLAAAEKYIRKTLYGDGDDHYNKNEGLPDKVWLKIIHYVEDPRDLINLVEANPAVASLVDREECRLEEVVPLLFQHLSRNSVLNLRLVCKRMKRQVNKILEEIGRETPVGNLKLSSRLVLHKSSKTRSRSRISWHNFDWRHFHRVTSMYALEIYEVLQLEKMLGQMQGQATRAPTRSILDLAKSIIVHISEVGGALNIDDLYKFCQLLPLLQDRVYYLVLYAEYRGVEVEYSEVQEALHGIFRALASNLRCLQIHLKLVYGVQLKESMRERIVWMESYLMENPLPVAPNLEILVVTGYRLPEKYFAEIAERYGGHLKTLGFELDDSFWNNNSMEEVVYAFPALEELQLSNFSFECLPWLKRIYAIYLKALRVSLMPATYKNKSSVPPFNQYFRIICNFPAMYHLTLDLGGFRVVADAPDTFNELQSQPHFGIRQLNIENWNLAVPLAVLLSLLPNLEAIQGKVCQYDNIANLNYFSIENRLGMYDKDLQLLYQGKMEHSKVWSDHPKLEKIEFWFNENPVEEHTVVDLEKYLRHVSITRQDLAQRQGKPGRALSSKNFRRSAHGKN